MDGLDFGSTVLSSLTSKIEQSFQSNKAGRITAGRTSRRKNEDGKQPIKLATHRELKNERKQDSIKFKTRKSNGNPDKPFQSQENSRSSIPSIKNSTNGKKRLRDGRIKDQVPKNTAPLKNPPSLKNEILELGGTQEDVDLLEGIGSGSEVEGISSKDNGNLGKEIKDMIKELGISHGSADEKDKIRSRKSGKEGLKNPDTRSKKVEVHTHVAAPPTELNTESKTRKSSALIFDSVSEWHAVDLPSIVLKDHNDTLHDDVVQRLHDYGKELWMKDNEAYSNLHKSSSSAHQFYSTIMSSGTLADKISALTLSVQESPLHNQRAMESLLGLARKRSRGPAIEALNALKDLFGPGSLLPSDRKLRTFVSQLDLFAVDSKATKNWNSTKPLPAPLMPIHLVAWAFEDWLKITYFEVLKIIETWCNDEIVYSRLKTVDIVSELLRQKPEQEANLLRLLVNKLGDNEKKIASRASYNILQLQIPHPLMKSTIISAIEHDILLKPGQSLHAKYYAIITLNQTVLSTKEEAVVRKILDIYFSLFVQLLSKSESSAQEIKKSAINKKGERQGGGGKPGKMARKKLALQKHSSAPDDDTREKIMSAVLTGINRALPYADTNDEFFTNHLDTLFKITHSSNFNTSVQALMLIQQLCGSQQAASDRFYRTLYESLLDPRLLTTSKQMLYLNLLYRALRADLDLKRIKAFTKRLLQVIALHQPAFSCAVIYLLRELENVFPILPLFIDQPQEKLDDEEHFHDAEEEMELNTSTGVHLSEISAAVSYYDGKKRAPEHANAEKTCLWELNLFLEHFHPSVSLFANRLLLHDPMPPKPTLDSHTLIQFLDRFVYKNPKKVTDKLHGSSIMQPMATNDANSLLISARSSNYQIPVNSGMFYKVPESKVDPSDAFFHKYFNTKAQGREVADQKKTKKQKQQSGSDEDTDEEEIWQALVKSHPDIEGPSDDSDMDLDMDDFEDEMNSDNVTGEDDEAHISSIGRDSDQESEALDFDDEDALLGSDDEIPSNLDSAFEKEVEYADQPEDKAHNDAGPGNPNKKNGKRRLLRNLPTFASVEDYAALLKDSSDEDK